MKGILILITLTLLVSVFTKSNTEISQEFLEGFFENRQGDFKFNNNCISNKLDSQYEKLANVVLAGWLDLGDVFRVMSEVEGDISSSCDFAELKEFNQIYTEKVKSGDFSKYLAFHAIHLAQIIRDLYDSAYRRDPHHIGTTMGKISDLIVYNKTGLKFLA